MSSRLLCAAMLLVAACDRAPSAADETAAELRALRMFLQQQPAARTNGANGATGADPRAAIAEALAPLREVVTALAQAQREQAARQLAMTQEMQRWSQLLVENVTSAHAGDGKAMTARLQQLEQSMREQDARHREIEAQLQGALERTADRLQELLRLLAPDPANEPSAAPASGGERTNGGKPSGATSVEPTPAADPPRDARSRDERSPSSGRTSAVGLHAEQWLWLALATVALVLGAFFVKRSRRSAPLRHGGPLVARTTAAPAEHLHDPGVDEIWAAAALLGETVNRLRQTGAAAPPAPSPAAAPSPEPVTPIAPVSAPGPTAGEIPPDELLVLGDFDARPPQKAEAAASGPALRRAAATAAAPNAAPRAGAPGPELVVCRLATADVEAARATAANVLAGDPRVLRRPAPSVVAAGKALEVTFATLPGLAAGERSLLEQRLRDAVT